MDVCTWITASLLLYIGKDHNVVNQLYFNTLHKNHKFKAFQEKKKNLDERLCFMRPREENSFQINRMFLIPRCCKSLTRDLSSFEILREACGVLCWHLKRMMPFPIIKKKKKTTHVHYRKCRQCTKFQDGK